MGFYSKIKGENTDMKNQKVKQKEIRIERESDLEEYFMFQRAIIKELFKRRSVKYIEINIEYEGKKEAD
jgi:hypothetical protein